MRKVKTTVMVAIAVLLLFSAASASLTAKLLLSINIEYSKTGDLATADAPIRQSRGLTLNNGTGANQADTVFQDNRTLADAANETIDIHDGTLSDDFGDALTLDKLKAIYVKNNSTDANLLIGGAAATQLGLFAAGTDKLKLPPGGEFLFTAPNAAGVDVTTNADLKMEHDGTGSSSLTYDIIAVGVD